MKNIIAQQIVSYAELYKECKAKKVPSSAGHLSQIIRNISDLTLNDHYNTSGKKLRDAMPKTQDIIDSGISYYQSSGKHAKPVGLEHTVPVKVINEFIEKHDFELVHAYRVIQIFASSILASADANSKLDAAGYREAMPEDWDFMTGDIFARYTTLGIQINFGENDANA